VHQSRPVSALLALCLVFGFGCEADVGADDTSVDDSAAGLIDVDGSEAEGDIGSLEQAITMPAVEPGGNGTECVTACTRSSATDLTGQCCVCNGVAKKFARSPVAVMYVCR
jgi:hypothetical protein